MEVREICQSEKLRTMPFPVDFNWCLLLADDPPEYNKLYLIPALGFLGGYVVCTQGAYPDIHQAAYLAASLCCVGALTGLSSQSTSRVGKYLGFFIRVHFHRECIMVRSHQGEKRKRCLSGGIK